MKSMCNLYRVCILCLMMQAAPSCSSPGEFVPREGDLVFVTAQGSPFSEAVADATAQGDSLKFDHVAIAAGTGGETCIIEATPSGGVARRSWSDFTASFRSGDGGQGFIVKRVTVDFPVRDAIRAAESHIGEEYDWSYLPGNGRMYCSELVYESYRGYDGRPLFHAVPMNFRNADGELPAFWRELFEALGEPVPEGVPGTNPNDMSKEPVLKEVYRYLPRTAVGSIGGGNSDASRTTDSAGGSN